MKILACTWITCFQDSALLLGVIDDVSIRHPARIAERASFQRSSDLGVGILRCSGRIARSSQNTARRQTPYDSWARVESSSVRDERRYEFSIPFHRQIRRISGPEFQVRMESRDILLLLAHFCLLICACSSESATTVADFGLAPVDPEIADLLDWARHACRRSCEDDAPPLDCYYTFKLEAYYTMSKACYDCPSNRTDCFRPHCVPADGVGRPILVVNRQMPGPAIEVCQGDRVIVDVINLLHSESTTMHWHGQHHVKTPYMDGVPYISQCPIPPGSTFRYEYIATEAGTHFWHSHSGFQRGDGVFGPLIVRVPPKRNWHEDRYDLDLHTLVVYDWIHELGLEKFLAHHHADGDNKASNLLINGFGRFKSARDENATTADMPIATFVVKRNLRYRFRLINAEFLNCPIEVSLQNHTMYVVSSDGRDVEPVLAQSLVSYAGERFDFIVEMDQEVGNYWIQFRGLMDCDERFFGAYQVAILRYEGAPMENPAGEVSYGDKLYGPKGLQVNALNEGTETNNSISMPKLKAMDKNDHWNGKQPDYQFYVSYDFYKKDNPHFHRKNLYGFYGVQNSRQRLLTPQLNHISMKLPSFPLLSQREFIRPDQFCNSTTVRDCEQRYCACTHVLQVKNGALVEMVLVDEGFAFDANHPFHLHGYQFRVVAMEKIGDNITVERVKMLDRRGLIRRNLDRAPLKDTVTVPDGGYTVLQFYADNPGYWLFHCHIEFHAEIGMSLIFKVGEHEEMLDAPKDFPRCGDWKLSNVRNKENRDKIATNTMRTTTMSVSPDELETNAISKNNIRTFLKILPEFLKSLRITSSAPRSAHPLFSLKACIFIFTFFIYIRS
ncbi:hypothetical protein KM043_003079 [Ampulex compressa]|nr:hypothetical protein KM043_003079 [Ampulex compressa]